MHTPYRGQLFFGASKDRFPNSVSGTNGVTSWTLQSIVGIEFFGHELTMYSGGKLREDSTEPCLKVIDFQGVTEIKINRKRGRGGGGKEKLTKRVFQFK